MKGSYNMAHLEQKVFCEEVKNKFPDHFYKQKVLDVGSLDINGNNRYLFEDSEYIGVDIGPGPNVDVVMKAHEYDAPDASFDVVISTECFEHDLFLVKTIKNIMRLLKSGGLFLFTCATTGRHEHGTLAYDSASSPFTVEIMGWDNYYKNLTQEDFRKIINLDEAFIDYEFSILGSGYISTLGFYGIRQ